MTSVRKFFDNTASLLIIQIASYLLPLVLLPYLSRVLGVEGYGYVAFGLSTIAMAGIVTDFGFDLYAPYAMQEIRDDSNRLKSFVGAVFVCKAILLCGLLAVLFATHPLWIDQMPSNDFAMALIFPITCGAFQSVWFFQGMESMRVITKFYILSRLLYIGMVLWLVKSPADADYVFGSFGAAQLFGSGLGFRKMVAMGFSPVLPFKDELKRVFQESSGYFASRAAVATYTTGGAFFLGVFSTPSQLAYYNAAEQLYRGAQGLFAPLAQALYPFMARTGNKVLFARVFVACILASLIGIAIGVAYGADIIGLVFGASFIPAHKFLLVFLVMLAVNIPSVLLGYPYLGALGQGRFVNWTVIVAGVVQLALLMCLLALDQSHAFGVLITILAAEVLVLTLRVVKVLRLGRL